MVLRKSIVLVLCVLSTVLVSCLEVAKEVKNWAEVEDINTIEGKTHFLSEDGIKIFLPSTFKKYTSVEYIALLDSLITDNEDLKLERERFRNIREMEGNHYVFFDNTLNATYTINTIPHTPITRQDAKYLLGIIRQSQDEVSEYTDLKYTKITAKHNDNGKVQVFKAIFMLEDLKLNQQAFQHVYVLSSKKKTALINLMAPFQIEFDPFLEKMII